MISCGCVSVCIFLIYLIVTALELFKLTHPVSVLNDAPSLDPLWQSGAEMQAQFYFSCRPNRKWRAQDFKSTTAKTAFVGALTDLHFNWSDTNTQQIVLNFSSVEHHKKRRIWQAIRSNETLFLHVFLTQTGFSPDPKAPNYSRAKTLHQVTPLITYEQRINSMKKNKRKLLAGYAKLFQDPPEAVNTHKTDPLSFVYTDEDPALSAPIISYWKPHFALRLVTDFTRYPLKEVPPMVFHNIKLHETQDSVKYFPAMYVDEMSLTNEKLLPLNRSVTDLPLTITYEPMTLQRWQMMLTFETAFRTQKSLGFTEKDIDGMRLMIAETNPYLLGFTMVVSLFHMLFDWLAFKSDINFWRENKSLVGISIRSMVISLFCQLIVFLYLYEQQTTLLVLLPSGITIFIQVWKIVRATGFSINFATFTITFSRLNTTATTATSEVDTIATKYMSFLLYPLLFGYSLYSLIYKDNSGWYSWILGSLTGTVYTFGFIMMTPQLFINYKLKSVSHLPWRFLIYRALNTFIDDLFAFIIHMPMMHRISCFRDDIIFIIYMYQRWIYPVDPKRKLNSSETEKEDKAIKHEHED